MVPLSAESSVGNAKLFSQGRACELIVSMRAPLLLFSILLFLQCTNPEPPSTSAAPQAAAGKVVSISGTATASGTKAGERQLVLGSAIFGDDRITTGADSAIDIRLEHNSALWTIQGSTSIVVDESAAWRTKGKVAGLFSKDAERRTSAAGRHSERRASDETSIAAETTSPPSTQPGSAAPGETETPSAGGQPAPSMAPMAPPPPPPTARSTAPMAPPPPSASSGSVTAETIGGIASGAAPNKEFEKRDGQAKAGSAYIKSVKADGGLESSAVKRLFRRTIYSKIKGCLEDQRGQFTLTYEFDKRGTVLQKSVRIESTPALPAKADTCIRNAMRSQRSARTTENTIVTIVLSTQNRE